MSAAVATEDLVYAKRGDNALLGTLYRPSGDGLFPSVISVRGGGWYSGDRFSTKRLDQRLAENGILVFAIDFRDATLAPYPTSIQDVNLAIRWLKKHAPEYGGRSNIGGIGCSSGGQQIIANALMPTNASYLHE